VSNPERARAAVVKLLIGLAWLLLALGASGFGPPTLGDGDPFAPSAGTRDLAAVQAAPQVPTTLRPVGAIVVEASTGAPIMARNADAPLAPASMTKMMTALVALEHASLSDVIRATERSLSEPSIIGLDPGDTLSLENMLYGLLLNSGNDAALAIAESVGGGSIDQFVAWMNDRAQRMGLRNTHFANPHGLDQAGHYSSPRDMAEIARIVMAEPTLSRIVGTRQFRVPGPPAYLFTTSNPLLGIYPGLDGVKTGFTDDAGRCLAASAVRDGQRLVSVVMNSPNYAGDTATLLDAGFAGVARRSLVVPYPGFSSLVARGPENGGLTIPLTGWEPRFMRAFTSLQEGGNRTAVSLLGKPVLQWVG
jgi:D-alanyl-D-alanine carboxypeptidase